MGLHIDIETYCGIDLAEVGVHKYAAHPSFEILLLAYSLDGSPVRCLDLTAEAIPYEVERALLNPGCMLHAHNANFERTCLAAYGYPTDARRWRCSRFMADYAGLPPSLAGAGEALGMEAQKFDSGKALISYFCSPCRPTKANGGRMRNLPEHAPDRWDLFKAYCARDVEAEMELSLRLMQYRIPQSEWEHWATDAAVNDAGIPIRLRMCEAAIEASETAKALLEERIKEITGIDNPNSAPQLKKWLSAELGYPVTELNKDSLPKLIADTAGTRAGEVLDMRVGIARAASAKYDAMLAGYMPTKHLGYGRNYGTLQFYGASTGRWSGRRIQPQNMRRPNLKDEELGLSRNALMSGGYEIMSELYEDVPDVIGQLVRTAIEAEPGNTLIAADYSAIEARVTAWAAQEQWRLDVFAGDGKIYEASAAAMFGVPRESIGKDSPLRQRGKVAELALGYGGSKGALLAMGAAKMGLAEAEIEDIVRRWRQASPCIVGLWASVESKAKAAISTKKKQEHRIDADASLFFGMLGEALYIELPSGRRLYYQRAKVGTNRFGNPGIQYRGYDKGQFAWMDTYGGSLVENIVQAISRDIMAEAVQLAVGNGLNVIFHVHDEIVCEVPEESEQKYSNLLITLMGIKKKWANGIPLAADGFASRYYKK